MLVLAAWLATSAAAEPFDLKGLRVNDPEASAAQRHPSLKCNASKDGGRFCSGKSTFAELPARLSYKTFEGKVIAVMVQIDPEDFDSITEALIEKFGEPTHRTGSSYMWVHPTEELTAIKHHPSFAGESSLLLRETGDTPHSRALKKEQSSRQRDM